MKYTRTSELKTRSIASQTDLMQPLFFCNRDSHSAVISGPNRTGPTEAVCSSRWLDASQNSNLKNVKDPRAQFELICIVFVHNSYFFSSPASFSQASTWMWRKTTEMCCSGDIEMEKHSSETWATTTAGCWFRRRVTTTSTAKWQQTLQMSVSLSHTRSKKLR